MTSSSQIFIQIAGNVHFISIQLVSKNESIWTISLKQVLVCNDQKRSLLMQLSQKFGYGGATWHKECSPYTTCGAEYTGIAHLGYFGSVFRPDRPHYGQTAPRCTCDRHKRASNFCMPRKLRSHAQKISSNPDGSELHLFVFFQQFHYQNILVFDFFIQEKMYTTRDVMYLTKSSQDRTQRSHHFPQLRDSKVDVSSYLPWNFAYINIDVKQNTLYCLHHIVPQNCQCNVFFI